MTEVPPPRIRVNADACPGPIRDILFRAAERGAGVQTGGQRQRHAQQSRLENHDARFAQASPY